MSVDLASISAFEVCSIRPPTENWSLTFRLTRNCYWNRCRFCPAYKLGYRFSKRSIDEIREDILRARLIDDLVFEEGIIDAGGSYGGFGRLPDLIGRIRTANPRAWCEEMVTEPPAFEDPRLAWFLPWFKDKPTLEDSLNHVVSWRLGGGETCFLGDADSLVLKPELVAEVIGLVRTHFPSIRRFTVYGRTRSAARLRSPKELKALRQAGLERVHFGVESGSDRVLEFMDKGVTKAEQVEGLVKSREAGLSCSVYVMPGLGGAGWSEEHALETADVLSKSSPDFVRLRTLQVFPQTPLENELKRGAFAEASEEQVIREIRLLLQNIMCGTRIVSDSATNLLDINGALPKDREAMLRSIDAYLDLPAREKLVFSLKSRLASFSGQYGGLSDDILEKLGPALRDGGLNHRFMSDRQVVETISLVRSKLMP